MAGDSACEHFRLGRFSMAETPVFQSATWGNVDTEVFLIFPRASELGKRKRLLGKQSFAPYGPTNPLPCG